MRPRKGRWFFPIGKKNDPPKTKHGPGEPLQRVRALNLLGYLHEIPLVFCFMPILYPYLGVLCRSE